ncbi:MAG TPA: formimidoylglutamase [Opitutaceae bacterium]|nr:formimidoylglutamase [Opitutaceae bacterium]HRJ47928.1 formimidoylglutamase [Opitutaceae bacterium]
MKSRPVPHTIAPRWPRAIPAGRFAATIRTDEPGDCRVALLGLADDTGVKVNHGRPGAAGGPTAFRAALAGYGANLPELPRVFDAGDIRPGRTLDETHARVTSATTALLAAGLFPVAVGGGHDLTFPFVRAVAQTYPRPAGIYFDAHLDVRETPGSGMPFRRLVEDCGVPALHLYGFRPLVNSAAHLEWFKAHGGRLHPDGAAVVLPRAKHLFVSFDLDVIDAAHAPGVSALNPAGWTVREAEMWVAACGAEARVRCFDLMELNPRFDDEGRTARVAAHLFLTFLQGFAQRRL